MTQRRSTSVNERLASCDCCSFPLSCRHHVLDFAEYGESDQTYNFCPNCHSIYHLAWGALVEKNKRAVTVWQGFLSKTNGAYPYIGYIKDKVQEAYTLKLEYDLSNTTKDRSESAFKVF